MSGSSWLIIGGGIHGVHIAARLIGHGGVAAEQVRILDPADTLLARWRTCTATTGMTHLRSPSVHHIDLDAWSLQRFAGRRRRRKSGLFAPPYNRPSLDLFNAHCDHVIDTYDLQARHIRGWASACRIECDGVTIKIEDQIEGTPGNNTGDGGELFATHIVLAIGANEQPAWPSWAPTDDPRVAHIFARGFSLPLADAKQCIAVVGGGISAAQTALRLADEGHKVHLISRHALRTHQFDSDPGWLGPKCMARFEQEQNLDRRRAMIVAARHRGSVPPGVQRALHRAIHLGRISWHEAGVDQVDREHGALRLRLSDGDEVVAEHVLLATGLSTKRPGGAMLERLIDSVSLPCAECGYPIVDSALRWHPRIHVTGPLAELALGPASRNIAGARKAGDKIIAALRSGAETQRA